MSIKSVRRYVAEDGSEFPSMPAAYKHNSLLKCYNKLREINKRLGATPVVTLVNNKAIATEMRDLCNRILDHHRRYDDVKTVDGEE